MEILIILSLIIPLVSIKYIFNDNKRLLDRFKKREIELFEIKDLNYDLEVNTDNIDLLKFRNTLIKNPNFDPKCFDFNIRNLVIKKNAFIKLKNALGVYIPQKSLIYTNGKYSTLNHELLHVASTKYIYTDSICKECSGFHRVKETIKNNNKYSISYNIGLNEGYTELLNQRYFGNNDDNSYILIVDLVSKLEQILTRDLMEKCYFKADFTTLYNRLLELDDKENIDKFLNYLDDIIVTNPEDNIHLYNNKTKEIIENHYNYILLCLLKWYIKTNNNIIDIMKYYDSFKDINFTRSNPNNIYYLKYKINYDSLLNYINNSIK